MVSIERRPTMLMELEVSGGQRLMQSGGLPLYARGRPA